MNEENVEPFESHGKESSIKGLLQETEKKYVLEIQILKFHLVGQKTE